MEVVPGFHWVNGRASNYYLLVEPDQLTLIDCGMPGQLDNLLRYLSQIGRGAHDISRILLTHADIDHVGSLAVIQAETGARVYGSAPTIEHVATGRPPKHLPRPVQWLNDRFGFKPVARAHLQVVREGDELPIMGGLEVLETPGHTLDHLSYYSPLHGVLIAGDSLNTRKDRLNLTPKQITADMAAARLSAIRLLELTPAVIACGHGKPLHQHKDDVLMKLYRQLT